MSSQALKVGIFASTKPDVDLSSLAMTRDDRFSFEVFNDLRYHECDIAVYFGSEKSGNSEKQKLRKDINASHRGPFLRSEVGFLGRRNVSRSHNWFPFFNKKNRRISDFQHSYYRFGINGIFPDDGEYLNDDAPNDRWERLKQETGIILQPYTNGGEHILLIGQTPGDASLNGINIDDWLLDTAAGIRSKTNLPILFRAHPGIRVHAYERISERLRIIKDVFPTPHTANIKKTYVEKARVVCCYSSSFSLDSLIAGIPVITLSERNIAAKYCSKSIEDIVSPVLPDRLRVFSEVAYAQWNMQEMSDGTVIKRYAKRLIDLCRENVSS